MAKSTIPADKAVSDMLRWVEEESDSDDDNLDEVNDIDNDSSSEPGSSSESGMFIFISP